jgi:hypothetical protein
MTNYGQARVRHSSFLLIKIAVLLFYGLLKNKNKNVFLLQVFCFLNILIYSLLPSGVASANILVFKKEQKNQLKEMLKNKTASVRAGA